MSAIINREEKQKLISDCYHMLKAKGLVSTQAEFAKLLGISRTSLSMAKSGREGYLTDNLINRLQAKMKELVGELPYATENVVSKGVFVPKETIDMYTSMAKSIERLTGIIDQLTSERSEKTKKGVS